MSFWKKYLQPKSVAEALEALNELPGPSAIVAGGTDLLLDLQQGRHPPVNALIDVSDIAEMKSIRLGDDFLFVGGAVTHHDIVNHPLLHQHALCLVEACELIGSPQLRNIATIGGNVSHALPAGDCTIALLALAAEAKVVSKESERWVPLDGLIVNLGELAFDRTREILTNFRIPRSSPSEGTAFKRVMRPQGVAIAILNMAVWLRVAVDGRLEDIRMSIGPAGPRPLRARKAEVTLRGKKLDEENIHHAYQMVLGEASLRTSPHRATKEYRCKLTGILLRDSLTTAYQRAFGDVKAPL
jgi:CO/xanthine dehydrogenase FAD-binding subunit